MTYPNMKVHQSGFVAENGQFEIGLTAVTFVFKEGEERKQFRSDMTVYQKDLTHNHFVKVMNDLNNQAYSYLFST